MACDALNRWYVSTQAGIRVYDPNGRPIGLVLAPSPAAVTSCAIAGDRLYALSQGRIWRRPVNLSAAK
jgi:sugar lactone lactonase YvrE